MGEKNKNNILKIVCYIIFFIYLIFLVKIVLFKYSGMIAIINKFISSELNGFRSLNLIPFNSIWEFTKIMFSENFFRGFNNIIGNVLIFAPLGYFLPLLFKKCKNIKITLLIGLLISCLFEFCQYFLYLGSADIDEYTKYSQKDIYDTNGNKVETKKATKDNLNIDKHINIIGYELDGKYYATKIVINNYLF